MQVGGGVMHARECGDSLLLGVLVGAVEGAVPVCQPVAVHRNLRLESYAASFARGSWSSTTERRSGDA